MRGLGVILFNRTCQHLATSLVIYFLPPKSAVLLLPVHEALSLVEPGSARLWNERLLFRCMHAQHKNRSLRACSLICFSTSMPDKPGILISEMINPIFISAFFKDPLNQLHHVYPHKEKFNEYFHRPSLIKCDHHYQILISCLFKAKFKSILKKNT